MSRRGLFLIEDSVFCKIMILKLKKIDKNYSKSIKIVNKWKNNFIFIFNNYNVIIEKGFEYLVHQQYHGKIARYHGKISRYHGQIYEIYP